MMMSDHFLAQRLPLSSHAPNLLHPIESLQCCAVVATHRPLTDAHFPNFLQPSKSLHALVARTRLEDLFDPLHLPSQHQSNLVLSTNKHLSVLVMYAHPDSFGSLSWYDLPHPKASNESESKSKNLMLSPKLVEAI